MTGEEFVKKIKPMGCAVFMLLLVGMVLTCLFTGKDPIKGYKAPENAAYYSQSESTMQELQQELQTNVFPKVAGVQESHLDGNVLVITIESKDFAVTRATILQYFDQSLFSFQEG